MYTLHDGKNFYCGITRRSHPPDEADEEDSCSQKQSIYKPGHKMRRLRKLQMICTQTQSKNILRNRSVRGHILSILLMKSHPTRSFGGHQAVLVQVRGFQVQRVKKNR